MPLQNRVTPQGELIADPARGLFMGNRGGRLHDPLARTLGARRHVSRRWICCVLDFAGRRRQVWGQGYTELFFLDEVTALSAGHRPCFECRRAAARAFQDALAGDGVPPGADGMDELLHVQRMRGAARPEVAALAGQPDGTVCLHAGRPHALLRGALRPWHPGGWAAPVELPSGPVPIVTPALVRQALRAGYRPVWHASAA